MSRPSLNATIHLKCGEYPAPGSDPALTDPHRPGARPARNCDAWPSTNVHWKQVIELRASRGEVPTKLPIKYEIISFMWDRNFSNTGTAGNRDCFHSVLSLRKGIGMTLD